MKANLPFLWNVIWVTKLNKEAFKNRTSVKLCVCRNKKSYDCANVSRYKNIHYFRHRKHECRTICQSYEM